MWQVAIAGDESEDQTQMVGGIQAAKGLQDLLGTHPAWMFKDTCNKASVERTAKVDIVLFGEKVYIPHFLRKALMDNLHGTHMSAAIMIKTIRSLWVWEGQKNKLEQQFQNFKPSKATQEVSEWLLVDRVGVGWK